jgi:hypothetical protein
MHLRWLPTCKVKQLHRGQSACKSWIAALVWRSAPIKSCSLLPGGGSPCLAVAFTGGTCAGSRCASSVAGSGLPRKTEAESKGNGPAAGRKGRGPAGLRGNGPAAGRKGRRPAGACCSAISRLLFKCQGASPRFHRLGGDGILSRRRFLEGRDTEGDGALLAPLAMVVLCLSFVWDSSISLLVSLWGNRY